MDGNVQIVNFPTFGIDLSQGQFDQRPGTSPLAVNVRAVDTSQRLRGGSRPGLTPFFGRGDASQVSGFNRIQSLSTIVRCDQGATFNSNFILIRNDVNYSETDHPPARDSPLTSNAITWYENTQPNKTFVTEPIVGVPDGGGTGRGTARFKISTDGFTVSLLCTFVSAGFPGPYFFSGHGGTFTLTQSAALFFNPVTSKLSSNWTVVSGSFIGNYFFNCYFPGP